MAKKRLSAVTKVTTAGDNDYIVMNTSDGKTVQIKKADFADVIADVMRVATEEKRGLISSALFQSIIGLTGWFNADKMNNMLTNQSKGITFVFFKTAYIANFTPTANYAIGFSFLITNENSAETQYIFDYAGKIYMRRHNGTEWGDMNLIMG